MKLLTRKFVVPRTQVDSSIEVGDSLLRDFAKMRQARNLTHQAIIKCALTIFLLQNSGWAATPANVDDSAATNSWISNEDSWHYWWSYSGVSGPAYWGLLNLDWFICDKGRRQSPIDIQTDLLVYDPHLGPLECDKNLINGVLYNDGHAIVFRVTPSPHSMLERPTKRVQVEKPEMNRTVVDMNPGKNRKRAADDLIAALQHQQTQNDYILSSKITETGSAEVLRELGERLQMSLNQAETVEKLTGLEDLEHSVNQPADLKNQDLLDDQDLKVEFRSTGLPYSYKFEMLHIRFGVALEAGSEHLINSKSFPAELQLIAYNSDLYGSYVDAATKPRGLLAIAILIDILPRLASSATTSSNGPLESLLSHLSNLKFRGSSSEVRQLNLSALLPETENFITYEGSLTTPGCHETVDWLVLNKPLYISSKSLETLRSISGDERSITPTGILIAGNLRPIQPINNRHLRTNIKPSLEGEDSKACAKSWKRYQYKSRKLDFK